MKIRVDVDCTPEEARRFIGLPDVSPLNDAFVAEAQRKMETALRELDGEKLMKTWLSKLSGTPFSAFGDTGTGKGADWAGQDWNDLQKRFWAQFFGGSASSSGDASDGDASDGDDPQRGGSKPGKKDD